MSDERTATQREAVEVIYGAIKHCELKLCQQTSWERARAAIRALLAYQTPCPECSGEGRVVQNVKSRRPTGHLEECPTCSGSGQVRLVDMLAQVSRTTADAVVVERSEKE